MTRESGQQKTTKNDEIGKGIFEKTESIAATKAAASTTPDDRSNNFARYLDYTSVQEHLTTTEGPEGTRDVVEQGHAQDIQTTSEKTGSCSQTVLEGLRANPISS